jgi:hypothetical protein
MAYNLGQLGRREIEDYPNEPLITIVCGRILKATLESRFKRSALLLQQKALLVVERANRVIA